MRVILRRRENNTLKMPQVVLCMIWFKGEMTQFPINHLNQELDATSSLRRGFCGRRNPSPLCGKYDVGTNAATWDYHGDSLVL